MNAHLTITHTHGERVTVSAAGADLLSYVYKPDPDPYEAPKPYIHPLRTLSGRLVSGYRPHDHRWHKGLQMSASHLSGQNFWGGHSYHGPEHGYRDVPEQVGSLRHDGFEAFDTSDPTRLRFTESLTWVTHHGDAWARERRTIEVHSAELAEGAYVVDWTTELTNLRSEPLRFGSPTTAGRERAGYTGLAWRGPRAFTGGDVRTPAGCGAPGEEGAAKVMGTRSPWLAFTGTHDDVDAASTLLFAHAPENDDAIHASHWFVRSEPIPTVALSWAFHEEFELPPGDSFRYRYRVVVADGAWDEHRASNYLGTHTW
ncbi:PmoA family protein [Streptomyces sp. NPDC047981]|uniref:DUF6807 domain-containing protein n=1 Tax=Streptomyces sp. NPDC047981 TaxID=3154610 RepID=UPI003447E4BA